MTKQIDQWCPRCHKYPLVQEIGMCWTCYGRELRVTEESKMKSEIELEIEKEFDLNEMNRLVAKKKPINRTHYQKWAKWQEVWLKNHIKNGRPVCEWSKLEQDLGVSEEKIKSKIKAMGITLEPDRPILTSTELDEAKNKGVNSGYAGMDKAEVDANFNKALETEIAESTEITGSEQAIEIDSNVDALLKSEKERDDFKAKWKDLLEQKVALENRVKSLKGELSEITRYKPLPVPNIKDGFVKIVQEDANIENEVVKLLDYEAISNVEPKTILIDLIEDGTIKHFALRLTVALIEDKIHKKYLEQGTDLIYYKK